MTKDELIKELARRTSDTQANAKDFLEKFVMIVEESLAAGDEVRLAGLGTFKVVSRAARTYVIEGKKVKKPPTKAVKFRPYGSLKEVVVNG